ncbi:MAG: type II secretion system protein [Candidatus Spechtbacteria bacterium]|nr:type II secretion system protein [Candidatus Spechtbacteria bacterium]
MINQFKKINSSKKGFTLIELLVVISIIGILAGVVLVSLNGARRSARDTKRVSDMKSTQLALELYYATNNKYPIAAADATCENFLTNLQGLIGQTFDDPSSGSSYQYAVDAIANPQSYTIKAVLEDTANAVLSSSNDKDGTANGCTCDDPAYCLQP